MESVLRKKMYSCANIITLMEPDGDRLSSLCLKQQMLIVRPEIFLRTQRKKIFTSAMLHRSAYHSTMCMAVQAICTFSNVPTRENREPLYKKISDFQYRVHNRTNLHGIKSISRIENRATEKSEPAA